MLVRGVGAALYRIFGIFAQVQKCQEQGLCRDKMSGSNGYCCLMSCKES